MELVLARRFAALLHPADIGPGALVLHFRLFEPLANFLDVAQARFFQLPLAAKVLEFLLDPFDFILHLDEPFARVFLVLVLEHSLRELKLKQLTLKDVNLGRHRLEFHRQAAGRFVDEVDRLVWEETIGDVSRRQLGGGDERGVFNFDLVMDLVTLL